MTRECGDCQECCTLLDIRELDLAAGTKCKHQCDKGCAIHRVRPDVCRNFSCLWRNGKLEQDQRPDKTGMILWEEFIKIDSVKVLATQCTMRKGKRDRKVMRFLNKRAKKMPVVMIEVTM
jgi:Fe-S-cluster containining protein